ncbi:hypothetical protein GCM10010124_08700 [Pilimelia terevasa]|uniref:GGDEF domain-containing protein n=1 Tax=Pilimelia terevasa TaxID=53372 RepID=A0A8J3BKY5_9ACTN|nr:GGDEF domain-containing protein [Pilimelia terevasa]GGK18360.1 hypothetical protein GCM10010124_08700 [Pilimelia terevasa]
MQNKVKAGELVPVEDRVRWTLGTRFLLAALVAAVWLAGLGGDPRGYTHYWLAALVGWPVLSAATLFAGRLGRRGTRISLTVAMLVDGVLLTFAWWATGELNSALAYVIILHAISVTLLASFRTGAKIAVWHSVLALMILEADRAGQFGGSHPYAAGELWLYLAAIWTAVLGTASFAAHNERELRRRRYDSEVLHQFGVKVVSSSDPDAVVSALAAFAQAELGAHRAAVLAYSTEVVDPTTQRLLAAVVDGEGAPAVHRMLAHAHPQSLVGAAMASGQTLLRSRLDAAHDPWLSEVMPQARAFIVVPFVLDQVRGALVMQMGRTGKWAPRVERRVVNTAEQATSQAAGALELSVLTERLRALSHTDGLTGVANRRRFDEVLEAELRHGGETGTHLGLLLIDIDHFKRLNDTYGHQVGDEVLKQVAQAVRAECPEPHLVARYGGEEFAVVLSGVDPVAGLAAGEAVRRAIAQSSASVPVTASIGVASYPGHGLSAAEVIAAADAALYRAKANGRDQVQAGEAAAPSRFGRTADSTDAGVPENTSGDAPATR